MKNKLNWQAFTSASRTLAIEDIKEIIAKNDGCIINFNIFSDLALNLLIEVEEQHMAALYKDLGGYMQISDLGLDMINNNSKIEWLIGLNISFS